MSRNSVLKRFLDGVPNGDPIVKAAVRGGGLPWNYRLVTVPGSFYYEIHDLDFNVLATTIYVGRGTDDFRVKSFGILLQKRLMEYELIKSAWLGDRRVVWC